jgi:hypothetical protein
MNKIFETFVVQMVLLLAIPTVVAAANLQTITENELLRRTQELFDSIVVGDQGPWKRYYADDCLFFDEKGRSMDKSALVKDISPFPKGYSGTIKIQHPQFRISDSVAIVSYDLDESETVFGQRLNARYHGTDTWLRRQGKWQIIATQMFRFYEDPSPGTMDPKMLERYVGTYQLGPGVTLTISRQRDDLYRKRGENPPEKLIPETAGLFFRKGVEGRILFGSDAEGKINQLVDRRNNEDLIWKRVNRP